MKKIFFIIILTAIVGCSSDDDISLSLSSNEIEFSVEGGEECISVTTDGSYDCSYSEDWLLVRQQTNKMRIIADPNDDESSREAFITVLCNGEARMQIHIVQQGINIEFDKTEYNVVSSDTVIHIPVATNAVISCDNYNEWYSVSLAKDGLNIAVNRNFNMEERCGTFCIKAGNVQKEIKIVQEASAWYNSIEMIEVEGGIFNMGSQNSNVDGNNYDEQAYAIESPVHKVTVSDFKICRFEITQAQWQAAMGNNPSTCKGDKLPVETVTWDDVQLFINALNEATGLEYRLPTEAEWEYAANGGNKSNGFKYSGYSVLGACAWYYSNSSATSHEVGSKEPNELGLYDMSGNVREWCGDWFEYYTSADAVNPQGASTGNGKVNKGGSWTTPAINCRNTYRQTNYVYESAKDLGFRLALSE